MEKRSPIVHRLHLREIESDVRDPRLSGLLSDGWTISQSWIQRDDQGEALMLLLVPPRGSDLALGHWPPPHSLAWGGFAVMLVLAVAAAAWVAAA